MSPLYEKMHETLGKYVGAPLDEFTLLSIKQDSYKVIMAEAAAQNPVGGVLPGRFDITVSVISGELCILPRNLFTFLFVAGVPINDMPAWVLRHDGPGEVEINGVIYIHVPADDDNPLPENVIMHLSKTVNPLPPLCLN